MYQVKIRQFSGPLEKLLQLIEEKHLDVTQVSLASVTEDFLNYVRGLGQGGAPPGTLADFLVVAAKLVLIKSKMLLPMLELTKEEEEDVHDLEARLKIYREFRAAGELVRKLWDKKHIAHKRELLASLGDGAVFYPPPKLAAGDLAKSLENLAAALQAFLPDTRKIEKAVVTIEQKIEELLNRVKEAGRHSFRTLSARRTREEAVVLFLALLHLLKEKVVKVEQPEEFGEITIERNR